MLLESKTVTRLVNAEGVKTNKKCKVTIKLFMHQ